MKRICAVALIGALLVLHGSGLAAPAGIRREASGAQTGDEAGKKLGVYEYRSFYTEDNGGWEPGPTDSDVSDDPDVSGEDGGNGDDGSGGAATGETFGGVAAALVLGLLAAGAALRLRVKH